MFQIDMALPQKSGLLDELIFTFQKQTMIDPTHKVGFLIFRLNTLFRYHSVPAFSTTKRILAVNRAKVRTTTTPFVHRTFAGIIVSYDN